MMNTYEDQDAYVPSPGSFGDDWGDDDGPPDFVLRCDSCGSEEPAPADMSPGETTDCAYCGEAATVEVE